MVRTRSRSGSGYAEPQALRGGLEAILDVAGSVIDILSGKVTDTISVGVTPFGVAGSPDGSTVYVTNEGDNTVSVINTKTGKVTTPYSVGVNPYGVAVSPDGSTVYVANHFDNTMSVINTRPMR
jgi:YVTN family beta-propeller protein